MEKKSSWARLAVTLSDEDAARVQAMAAKSEVSLQSWLASAIMHAVRVDEAHWAEMAEREAIKREQRSNLGIVCQRLRNLTDGEFNAIADVLVAERQKGREEGSASAMRLAEVRARAIVVMLAEARDHKARGHAMIGDELIAGSEVTAKNSWGDEG